MATSFTVCPLFTQGCVLQSGMPAPVWGTGVAGDAVTVSLCGRTATATVADDGTWRVTLDALEPGGPFAMTAHAVPTAPAATAGRAFDAAVGREPVTLTYDVYVGEVFVCAGQSNMEYSMASLHWRYPAEFTREPDPLLRHCKVPVRYDFHGPRRDFDEPVRWVGAAADTLDEFTGVGYFFGRMVREWLGVPVGLLNITLGGSPIEAWMDERALAAWPLKLAEVAPYRDDAEAQRRIDAGEAAIRRWYDALHLDRTDATALADWTPGERETPALAWRPITLPSFLADAPDPALHGLRGSVYLHRTVVLPRYHDGAGAALHLGMMVDADVTYINGARVGCSEYQYRSRDYTVPQGVLRAGRNDIVVRLVVERGNGRVTPGKPMRLDVGDDTYDLSGAWSYAIGTVAHADRPDEDCVRWRPTGLYYGMAATCAGYAARAVLWYQGESNTGDGADDYGRMLESMIRCWRAAWGQERLPFLIVQLPGYSIDGVEDGGWPLVRHHEWQVQYSVVDVATAVTLDAGDWNDLHPWNKRLVAERLFVAAQRLVYGVDDAPRSAEAVEANLTDGLLTIRFDDGTGRCGLCTLDGSDPGEFELVWDDGSASPMAARVHGDTVVIDMPWRKPSAVRYAWSNAPSRGLLYGANGLPVPPFTLPIA